LGSPWHRARRPPAEVDARRTDRARTSKGSSSHPNARIRC
jgi:hypothetical protein